MLPVTAGPRRHGARLHWSQLTVYRPNTSAIPGTASVIDVTQSQEVLLVPGVTVPGASCFAQSVPWCRTPCRPRCMLAGQGQSTQPLYHTKLLRTPGLIIVQPYDSCFIRHASKVTSLMIMPIALGKPRLQECYVVKLEGGPRHMRPGTVISLTSVNCNRAP